MSRNIVYKTDEIREFFKDNRQQWDQFYPSERWVFEHIAQEAGGIGKVLDVGCACGGLGAALAEKFSPESYTGIDIHEGSIAWARENQKTTVPSEFIAGDILTQGVPGSFDVVTSLSCADWNIETERIVKKCWEGVKPGGYFVISMRVVPTEGVNDITKSYQRINYSGREKSPELANYVIVNFDEALLMFKNLSPEPSKIGAYGYWGKPSSTAVTVYKDIVFAVFYIKKIKEGGAGSVTFEFSLPPELMIDQHD